MLISFHPVLPPLHPYVQAMFASKIPAVQGFTTLYSATTGTGVMFFFGAKRSEMHYNFVHNPQKSYVFDSQDIWVGGLHNEPLVGSYPTNAQVICAVLKPKGILHLMRDDLTQIINDGVPFEAMNLHHQFDGLFDKLRATEDEQVAMKLVETYLLNYFSQLDIPFSVKDMSPVTDYINRQQGKVKVQQLEEKFRVSRRWLEKQFAAQVGFSPKEYAKMTRFKSFAMDFLNNPTVQLGYLIEEYGYYDRSHLIKDFQQYTGQTPIEFFKLKTTDFLEVKFLES